MSKTRQTLAVVALAALVSSTLGAQTQGSSPQRRPATAKPVETARPAPSSPPPAPTPPAPNGFRLKTVTTQGAQVSENTTYIQGARRRVESPDVVSIDQCDTKKVVMLNTTPKRYKAVQPLS